MPLPGGSWHCFVLLNDARLETELVEKSVPVEVIGAEKLRASSTQRGKTNRKIVDLDKPSSQ